MRSKAHQPQPRAGVTKANGASATSRNGEASSIKSAISIEADFYAWLRAQARAVRERRLDAIDWENVAEELDGMAGSQKHAVTSHLRVLLAQLLKWSYQTTERELHIWSWRASIGNSRQEIQDALEESPSLGNKQNLSAFMPKAYGRARQLAAAEMGLSDREMNRTFPGECPWTFEQFMVEGFLPEQREAARSSR